jgi:hypothetical protein
MQRTIHLAAGAIVVATALVLGTRGSQDVIEAQAPSTASTTVPRTVIATNVPMIVATTTAAAVATPTFIPARAITATVTPSAASPNGATASITPTPAFVPATAVTPTASPSCAAAGAIPNSVGTGATAGGTPTVTPTFIPARVLDPASLPPSGTTAAAVNGATPAATPTFIPAVAITALPSPISGTTPLGGAAANGALASAAGTTPSTAPTFIPARAVTATPSPNGTTTATVAAAAATQPMQPLVASTDGVGVITLDLGGGSTIGPVQIIGFGGGFTFAGEGPAARNAALPVVVAKLIDAASPKLLSLALKGQCINGVQVLLCQSAATCTAGTAYAIYTLAKAHITEARIGDDVAGPVLTEQFKITYEQIKLSTPGGAAAPQGDLCFDMTANSPC